MNKQYSQKADLKLLEKAEKFPAGRIWLEACGTAKFVLVELVRRLPRHADVTPALMAAMPSAKY